MFVMFWSRPCAQDIRDHVEEYEVGMQLVGWFYNDYPGLGVDKKMISDLARLNVDFYHLYSSLREDS